MASPGQRRGVCGHMMAGFDQHECCARCRDKKLGSDRCVEGKQCYICDNLTDQQRSMISTPQYQIRKDKKSGLLVSPSKVTVVGVVDQDSVEIQPDIPAHSYAVSGPQETFQVSHHSADEFVSRQDFDFLSNQLEEKFARFEALLSRTNIFSTPKIPVSTVSAPVSDNPFFIPSDPRATGPVRSPGPDEDLPEDKPKEKKNKGTGKKGKKAKTVPLTTDDLPDKSQTGSLKVVKSSDSAKVDIPSLGACISLGQDSTKIALPVAPDAGASQELSNLSDCLDVESLTSRSDKGSDDGGNFRL